MHPPVVIGYRDAVLCFIPHTRRIFHYLALLLSIPTYDPHDAVFLRGRVLLGPVVVCRPAL